MLIRPLQSMSAVVSVLMRFEVASASRAARAGGIVVQDEGAQDYLVAVYRLPHPCALSHYITMQHPQPSFFLASLP